MKELTLHEIVNAAHASAGIFYLVGAVVSEGERSIGLPIGMDLEQRVRQHSKESGDPKDGKLTWDHLKKDLIFTMKESLKLLEKER